MSKCNPKRLLVTYWFNINDLLYADACICPLYIYDFEQFCIEPEIRNKLIEATLLIRPEALINQKKIEKYFSLTDSGGIPVYLNLEHTLKQLKEIYQERRDNIEKYLDTFYSLTAHQSNELVRRWANLGFSEGLNVIPKYLPLKSVEDLTETMFKKGKTELLHYLLSLSMSRLKAH